MNRNNPKKSKQCLTFIGRCLLFICLAFTLLPSLSANAQVVENKKYGFSLIVPDEWKVVYGRGESQGTLLFSAFDKETAGRIVVSAMPPYPIAMYSTEYSEILDIFVNRFNANRPEVKVESTQKDTIANQEANIAVYSWPAKDGGRQIVIKAAFWINDTILDINGAFKESQREQGLQLFSEILKSLKLNESTSRDWAKLGYSYQQDGNYAKAGEAFTNAARLHLKNVDNYYQLAYSNAETGSYSQAINAISKAIELKPKVAFNYLERAYSHIKLRNAEAALADTNQAIALDPNQPIFYAGRGNAYALMEKYPEAIKDFEKCLELQGKPLDSQFNLGQVYELTGNQEKALFYYSMIAKIPDLPEPVNVKIQARMRGDWDSYKEWI